LLPEIEKTIGNLLKLSVTTIIKFSVDDKITTIFVIVRDLLQAIGHQDGAQRRMTDAKVITTALVVMLFYHGNFESTCSMLIHTCRLSKHRENHEAP